MVKRAAPYDREAALDAAITLFWRKGYHATSLKDIEAALQMKPGSIYAAFTSKERLFLLALERYFEQAREGFREVVANADSPLEALEDNIRGFARLSPDDQNCQACMLAKTLLETGEAAPEIAARARGWLAEMSDEFAAIFERAKELGELPADADVQRLARRYQANISALRFELSYGAGQESITLLAEDMARDIGRVGPAVPPASGQA